MVASASSNLKRRKSLAWCAFWKLEQLWKSPHISIATKVKLFNTTCVTIILLYMAVNRGWSPRVCKTKSTPLLPHATESWWIKSALTMFWTPPSIPWLTLSMSPRRVASRRHDASRRTEWLRGAENYTHLFHKKINIPTTIYSFFVFCFVLFCFVLFCFFVFCFLFCFVLFCFVLFCLFVCLFFFWFVCCFFLFCFLSKFNRKICVSFI